MLYNNSAIQIPTTPWLKSTDFNQTPFELRNDSNTLIMKVNFNYVELSGNRFFAPDLEYWSVDQWSFTRPQIVVDIGDNHLSLFLTKFRKIGNNISHEKSSFFFHLEQNGNDILAMASREYSNSPFTNRLEMKMRKNGNWIIPEMIPYDYESDVTDLALFYNGFLTFVSSKLRVTELQLGIGSLCNNYLTVYAYKGLLLNV